MARTHALRKILKKDVFLAHFYDIFCQEALEIHPVILSLACKFEKMFLCLIRRLR